MDKEYTAPEVKLVGNVHDVVLGSLGVGTDIRDEVLPIQMEFAEDSVDSIS
jgi:hypothetical protein